MFEKDMKSFIRKGGVQKSKISFAALLHIINTVRLRKALRVIWLLAGGEALSRAEPPAGPPKSRYIAPANEFSKIRTFFGVIPGPILQ